MGATAADISQGLQEVTISASRLPAVRPAADFRYLKPASWKSTPFGVFDTDLGGGRKVAVHEYPSRDDQWPEDLGRRGRSLRVMGFLVNGGGQYGGDGAIQAQAQEMLEACESAGPGDLVHPLYGRLTMQLVSFEFRHAQAPGVLELRFEFAESGPPLYPQVLADTQSQSKFLGFAAMAACAQSFAIQVTEAVHSALGGGAISAALVSFTSIADIASTTATSLVNMVGILPGEFGRFVGQTVTDAQKTASSVEGLAALGASARESVAGAAAALLGAADQGAYASPALMASASAAAAGSPQSPSTAVLSAGDVVDVASGIQALVQSVQAANSDPAAAVRACLVLADFPAVAQASSEQVLANQAVTALARRMALAAAVQSSAAYVPASQQDAAAMRAQIATPISAEMLIAGDAGDDSSYLALQALLAALAADMAARGASLPQSVQVGFSAPLPSLVLAQRLYQDATRESQLVQEGNPISPLFMPTVFQALTS
ncbi:MAG: DNA circularization N-terminal domain-containing protein [Patescibacteria group bacterium]|nr:DNA circularization N-terminal domain-containing protein [Patescibacteria group bacterium]